MKKVLAIAMLCAVMVGAFSVSAIDIENIRAPQYVANATATVVRDSAASVYGIATSLTAFSGSGDEFYVEAWGDWVTPGTFAWSTPMSVPGSMTLPKISRIEQRYAGTDSADFYAAWRFYCATDSLTVLLGDR
jgi:hypothetical protein